MVDGANVSFVTKSGKGDPKVSNLLVVKEAPEERGYKVIIIVDASLRHKVDDSEQLEG